MNSPTISAPLSSLTGVIERITFHSEESGYTVARLNTGNVKQNLVMPTSELLTQLPQILELISKNVSSRHKGVEMTARKPTQVNETEEQQ